MKPKDIIGIPWRVAFALQEWGWYLRSDIIWAKPNPLPESVTDRPTKSHEYVFLLTKSERYFYDEVAIRETRTSIEDRPSFRGGAYVNDATFNNSEGGSSTDVGNVKVDTTSRHCRSVWNIATYPYKGAHFATFPPALVEPCLLAGTSAAGECPKCGKAWVRVVERQGQQPGRERNRGGRDDGYTLPAQWEDGENPTTTRTIGWRPQCTCNQAGIAFEPGDLEIISTPTGESAGEDPTIITGRAGMNRPRGDGAGTREMTRYQQRRYSAQLRHSPHRAEMEEIAGKAFAHYIRTDKVGARPIPQALLDQWIAQGWLEPVSLPEFQPFEPVPQTVLDPFNGAATTGIVAAKWKRRYFGIDLNPEYIAMSHRRLREVQPVLFQS